MTTRIFLQLDENAHITQWFMLRDEQAMTLGTELNDEVREILPEAAVIVLLPEAEAPLVFNTTGLA